MSEWSVFIANEKLVLTAQGVWLANGSEITHESTARAFFKNLVRDEEGYRIQLGKESKSVEVEDTAYFVTALVGSPVEGIQARLSDESLEPVEPASLRYRPGRLVLEIERRGMKEEAKFLHSAYFGLLSHLEEDEKSYFLTIQGKRVVLAEK